MHLSDQDLITLFCGLSALMLVLGVILDDTGEVMRELFDDEPGDDE